MMIDYEFTMLILYKSCILFKMEMRIKKRPSLTKLSKDKDSKQKQKVFNMTMTQTMFSHKELREAKLPPLRPNLRKTSMKFNKLKQQKPRQQTQTTVMGSQMLQSYYQTLDKGWVKPSEYLQDIKQVNLIGDNTLEMESYEVKLSQKMQKNMAKLDSLMKLMQKWISILRKILQYTTSKKSNTNHLLEEVKFWRALSKKFDQLQYEFNNDKISQLLVLMRNSLKAKPQYKNSFEEFVKLKDKVIETTPLLRKLYLSLEEGVAGNIQRFSQNSDIVTSTQYLIRILLNYKMIQQNNEILRNRMPIVYDKMNDAMIQKLTVASLYPRQLANISSIKQKYAVVDKALSFYSNLLSIIEQNENSEMQQILERVQHTRNVLVNLLQIMGYFQYLYKKREVLEFSKLFANVIQFNIFDYLFEQQWAEYMDKVNHSMQTKKYQA